MLNRNRKGLTIIESLVAMFLLAMFLSGIFGAYYISRLGTSRAKHRLAAMSILKEFIEYEISQGYEGGSDDDYFANPRISFVAPGDIFTPIPVVIDDKGTLDAADDLMGTIVPDPLFERNIEDETGSLYSYPPASNFNYKIAGFVVRWQEEPSGQNCSERSVVYIADHHE